MGGTRWSDDDYKDRAAFRADHDIPAFAHDADVRAGKASGIHDKMNPNGVKMRESRDSDAHPDSHAVAVLFDVTGSMSGVPRTMQKELCKLMGLLIRKGYLEHPAIMVGAIGDATCDGSPLQVGQFESGIEIEEDLSKLHLEGGGGGHITESYELAMYFMARHTAIDCYEKRGKKGYCNTPDAPIWMAEQTFKPIGEVQPGDKIMGWEKINGRRSLVITTVEAVKKRQADNVVKVTTESGRVLKCTDDHQWLSGWHGKDEENNDIWTTVANRYGKGALLSHVIDPIQSLPNDLQLYAWWLAGIYDGEGHVNGISQSKSHNPSVCQRIEDTLTKLGFDYNYREDTYYILGGLQTCVKLLAWLPITRRQQLLDAILFSKWAKYKYEDENRPSTMSRTGDRVAKIEPLPAQEVVSLQTTTHNYVAWGFASSNCFIIGDETPYASVKKEEINEVIGDKVQDSLKTSELVKELQEQWEVYYILPNMTSHYNDKVVFNAWQKLLGQNVLKLEDPTGICELIASVVGVAEGKVDTNDVADDLKDFGAKPALVSAITKALVPVSGDNRISTRKKGTDISVPDSGEGSGIEKL